MSWKKETIKISIETIDNGYVTTISNEFDVLIASWYDVLKSDALRKIGDQLGGIIPGGIDDPHPYTEGLEGRELTEAEADGMNEEMKEIRDEHLKKGLKTGAEETFEKAQGEEFNESKEKSTTKDNTENKDRKA